MRAANSRQLLLRRLRALAFSRALCARLRELLSELLGLLGRVFESKQALLLLGSNMELRVFCTEVREKKFRHTPRLDCVVSRRAGRSEKKQSLRAELGFQSETYRSDVSFPPAA